MDYKLMLDFHRESQADVTIGVVPMPLGEAHDVGVIEVDPSSRVIGFEEKPTHPKARHDDPKFVHGSMGIYIFNRRVLEEELTEDAKKDTAHDFGKNIIPQIIQKQDRRVMAYQFVDRNKNKEALYWRDVGTLDAYYEANIDLVQVSPLFNIYDRAWPIRTYQLQYPPAKFVFNQEKSGRKGIATDSLVADGCIISGGTVERCILSPNVRVNSFAEVQDSLILEGVDIGRHAKVKNAIIDKFAKIMPNAAIGYDKELDRKRFHITPKGIVVVEKGLVVEA